MQVIFYYFWDYLAHLGYFETRIPLKPALGGVCSLANYSVAHEETKSNRLSNFCDFVCSLFPKVIFFYFYFTIYVILCFCMYVLVNVLFWIAVRPFFGKKLSSWLSTCSFCFYCSAVTLSASFFPFWVLERKVIVSNPDHCLSFYFHLKIQFDRQVHRFCSVSFWMIKPICITCGGCILPQTDLNDNERGPGYIFQPKN